MSVALIGAEASQSADLLLLEADPDHHDLLLEEVGSDHVLSLHEAHDLLLELLLLLLPSHQVDSPLVSLELGSQSLYQPLLEDLLLFDDLALLPDFDADELLIDVNDPALHGLVLTAVVLDAAGSVPCVVVLGANAKFGVHNQ